MTVHSRFELFVPSNALSSEILCSPLESDIFMRHFDNHDVVLMSAAVGSYNGFNTTDAPLNIEHALIFYFCTCASFKQVDGYARTKNLVQSFGPEQFDIFENFLSSYRFITLVDSIPPLSVNPVDDSDKIVLASRFDLESVIDRDLLLRVSNFHPSAFHLLYDVMDWVNISGGFPLTNELLINWLEHIFDWRDTDSSFNRDNLAKVASVYLASCGVDCDFSGGEKA